ncbi:halocyanin [Halobacteriales archaeon QS_1_68_20]|nr:MAG: halocyanin [Halobacteriales archaeon QS_1_68_20]
MNRRRVLAGLGGATFGLSGCLGVLGQGCSGDEFDVGMTPTAFDPTELTVEAGTTVVWLNDSDRAHTVTAVPGIPDGAEYFASGGYETLDEAREAWKDGGGAIYTCETYEHTFEVPGTYEYLCIPHESAGMFGTVVVEE